MSSYRNVRSAVGRRTATFLAALGAVVALMSFGSAPAFAAPSAAASCTGTVAGLETAAGDQQVAKVGTAFSTDLEVQVVGTGGCPLQGATVTFTAPTSGPTASFAGGASIVSVATGAAGSASAPQLTANDVTGTYQVEATVGSFSLEFSLTNTTVGTVSSITAVSGNDQSAAVGAEFAAPLTVSVTDAFGDPIEGASVTFSVPSSKAG
ncbi:MAG TPA: hypothetical protein VFN61_06545, partial [Acidimicrobiales bacterium]|nr:hypothetical protein [Acidimicrobiales bacterium]